MSQPEPSQIRRPRADDRLMRDVLFGVCGYPAVLVAHDLKLFPLLAERPRSLGEVCDALQIAPRPAEALLSLNASLGLLEEHDTRYCLTAIAEDYLLENSPTYYGGYFDLMIRNYATYSFESLNGALLTDRSQFYGGQQGFKSHQEPGGRAPAYTPAMPASTLAAALARPEAGGPSRHR